MANEDDTNGKSTPNRMPSNITHFYSEQQQQKKAVHKNSSTSVVRWFGIRVKSGLIYVRNYVITPMVVSASAAFGFSLGYSLYDWTSLNIFPFFQAITDRSIKGCLEWKPQLRGTCILKIVQQNALMGGCFKGDNLTIYESGTPVILFV